MATTMSISDGPWHQTLRSSGRGTMLTSSMVDQSPAYHSHFRTAGKTLGCSSPGETFDYTGKYSLSGDGNLRPIKPTVQPGADPLFVGVKFAKEFHKVMQDRKNPPKKKKERYSRKIHCWTPPNTLPTASIRRDQESNLTLR